MVDFTKKLAKKGFAKPTDPQQIYENLDRESDKGPLRPSQISVLERWHNELRANKDVILKMHTGQGKTLVGLLMLQSKLNEFEEPVAYLCPNNHLVEQTLEQAKQFGIHCITVGEALPTEFTNGQAILITTVQKLFNGKTKFGLGTQSQKVSTILMDDAHSCVDSIKDAFTIKITNNHPIYQKILSLFDMELNQQGNGTFAEIKLQKSAALLPIPYWAWIDKQADIVEAFSNHMSDDGIKFAWPLLKDILGKCLCVVTGTGLEITPYHSPLYQFGTYSRAEHRIFMSATVTNDAFLIKGLGIDDNVIKRPLVDRDETWSGEKMILIPSLIDSSLSDESMINLFGVQRSKRRFGIVVITPSFIVSQRWENAGAEKVDAKNIQELIGNLRNGNCEKTVVISNRYDGIDLPDSACRVLILDSAPKAQSIIERYLQSQREGSEVQEMNIARSIEQGLGRAVRGEKDYCVIVLLGADLVDKVKSKKTQKFFSPQTRKQIEIGLEITKMVREEAIPTDPKKALVDMVNQCLNRDEGWKNYYAQEMQNLPPSIDNTAILQIFSSEALAEKLYEEGKYDEAVNAIQKMLDDLRTSEYEKGWYLQEMARYIYPKSKPDSNKYQAAAHKNNRFLLRPREGMVFSKITTVGQKRAERIIDWIKLYESFEDLSISIDALLSRLTFGIDSDVFEKSLNDLAEALGFEGQRPDKEMKEGPDNLWALQENQYLLIECKNEVLDTRSHIIKDETGQMNNSIGWFRSHYQDAVLKNIMVHPTKNLGLGAFFNEPVGIMGNREIRHLIRNVQAFFKEFKGYDFRDLSEGKVQELLNAHQLGVEDIVNGYSVNPIEQ